MPLVNFGLLDVKSIEDSIVTTFNMIFLRNTIKYQELKSERQAFNYLGASPRGIPLVNKINPQMKNQIMLISNNGAIYFQHSLKIKFI